MRGGDDDDIAQLIQEHDKLVEKVHRKKRKNHLHPQDDSNNLRYQRQQEVVSVAHQNNSHSIRQSGTRRQRFHQGYYNNLRNDFDGGIIDPTVCHIRRGLVVMPIEMSITDQSLAPAYSMKQSSVALYAAFPPPPPVTNDLLPNSCDEYEMNQVAQRLRQYSGFYVAVGTTSATHFGQGYAETILSLNYRFPTLLPVPFTMQRNRKYYAVGNLHSNVHFGPTTNLSLSGTLSSLNGKTNLRFETHNPLLDSYNNSVARGREKGILHFYPQRRYHTLTVSRNLFASSPVSVHLITKITPARCQSFGYFNIMVTSQDTTNDNISNEVSKPKISLCVGYGEPSPGGEALWMSQLSSSSDVYPRNCGINIHKTDFTSGSHGARIQLDVEQTLSQSQACQSTIQYHHAGQALSLGAMFTRTFASSKLASVGVGIRHTFANIFMGDWLSKGVTSWMFQIKRGETRIVIPITIQPVAVTTWDSIIRLCYVSLATMLVDTLVAELLCDEISKLRLKLLKFVLREESVIKSYSSLADRHDVRKAQDDESRWFRAQLITKAKEEALRQRDLMKRQASNAMKKEEEQDGLVILSAIYGVIDNETGEWIQTIDNNISKLHIMDATTQLQFWTESSALHMSDVSKQHCLGFYDVLACVSEDDWKKPEVGSNQKSSQNISNPGLFQWLRKIVGTKKEMDNKRDLVAALQVRYKWAGQEFVKLFHDEDAIDLP